MKVGIIGGGATGLTAGYELLKRGHEVEIFEAAPFLGGQASTFEIGGGRLERGYHHLFMSDNYMIDLIRELGLGDKLAWIESSVGFFHDGKIWPFGSPKDILRFGPLTLFDRLRLGLVTLYLQKTKNGLKFEGITAAEWLQKRVGKNAYRIVWEPMLRGKFGDHYAQVGMTWLWGKIYLRVSSRKNLFEKEKLVYPMGSFGEVFDTLGEAIKSMGGKIYISSKINRIVVEDSRATGLEIDVPGNDSCTKKYDLVLATTPSYVFTKLVTPLPGDYLKKLTDVTYLSAVLVILVLDRPLTHTYWINVADRAMPFVGIIEHTNFVSPKLYGGKHLVYLTNYPSADSAIYKMSREDLFELYVTHLKAINPKFDRSWVKDYFHYKVDGAQPVIGTNYSQSIPHFRTPIKGLYLANTTQIYPEDRGTNYSVRLGKEVVELLINDYGSVRE